MTQTLGALTLSVRGRISEPGTNRYTDSLLHGFIISTFQGLVVEMNDTNEVHFLEASPAALAVGDSVVSLPVDRLTDRLFSVELLRDGEYQPVKVGSIKTSTYNSIRSGAPVSFSPWRSGEIRMFPKADIAYTLKLTYQKAPSLPTLTDGDYDEDHVFDLPPMYDELLIYGAIDRSSYKEHETVDRTDRADFKYNTLKRSLLASVAKNETSMWNNEIRRSRFK